MRDALRKQTQPDQAKNASARPRPARVRFTTQPLATVTSQETAPNISAIPASMIASCPRRPRTLAKSSGSPAAYRGSAGLTFRPKMQLISTSPSPHYAVAAESGSHDITARPCKANVSGKGENCRLSYPSFPEIQQDTIPPRQGERWRRGRPAGGWRAQRAVHLADQLRGDRQPQPVPPVSRLRESSRR